MQNYCIVQFLGGLKSIRRSAFSFKKYCSSLVIVVKILIFAHSDAEAPP